MPPSQIPLLQTDDRWRAYVKSPSRPLLTPGVRCCSHLPGCDPAWSVSARQTIARDRLFFMTPRSSNEGKEALDYAPALSSLGDVDAYRRSPDHPWLTSSYRHAADLLHLQDENGLAQGMPSMRIRRAALRWLDYDWWRR